LIIEMILAYFLWSTTIVAIADWMRLMSSETCSIWILEGLSYDPLTFASQSSNLARLISIAAIEQSAFTYKWEQKKRRTCDNLDFIIQQTDNYQFSAYLETSRWWHEKLLSWQVVETRFRPHFSTYNYNNQLNAHVF